MAHFHIEGLPPYDGDHKIELEAFTNRELHLIKEISGVRAAELEASFNAGDNDLVVAFAVIALQRAGLTVDRDRIWDAPVGAIKFVADQDGQSPPVPASTGNGAEHSASSGPSSRTAGDHQESGQSPIGSPSSETTAPSDPVTSAT